MIYRTFFIIFFVLLISPSLASEFGEYRYSKYIGIQQQMQNRQAAARIIQARYNSSPTRNIRYPDSYNKYPNIQRTQNTRLTPYQRYSPAYYQNAYR